MRGSLHLKRALFARTAVATLLAAGAAVAAAPAATAATITVTTTNDFNSLDGECSLREALHAARTDDPVDSCDEGQSGLDVILLAAETYTLNRAALGGLTLDTPVVIQGAGTSATTVTDTGAGGADRLFTITTTDTALRKLTVDAGSVTSEAGIDVSNSGELTLTKVIVRNGDSSQGAGAYNAGTLNVMRSRFTGNYASGQGGAIHNLGDLNVTYSTFDSNVAGVQNGYGGAISSTGSLVIDRSTFTNNTSKGYGGAIYAETNSAMTLTNSTITGNQATDDDQFGEWGGGLVNYGAATLNNVTITDNLATQDGGGLHMLGYASTSMTMSNSIVANNTLTDPDELAGENCDLARRPDSLGYNLEDGDSCQFSLDEPDGTNLDLAPAEPRLLPLGSYGGPTQTRPGRPTSAVLDAGSPEVPGSDEEGACEALDQRDVARPQDGADQDFIPVCDVGAFEMRVVGNNKAITITLRQHLRATGRVTTTQSSSCVKNEPVEIQRRRRPDSGTFVVVATTRTDGEGRYEVELPHEEGTYRARTSRSQSFVGGDIHTCEPSWSPEPYPKHEHN